MFGEHTTAINNFKTSSICGMQKKNWLLKLSSELFYVKNLLLCSLCPCTFGSEIMSPRQKKLMAYANIIIRKIKTKIKGLLLND